MFTFCLLSFSNHVLSWEEDRCLLTLIDKLGMSVRVMCVGLACVDIVSVCKNYPEEDSDQRQASILKNRRFVFIQLPLAVIQIL